MDVAVSGSSGLIGSALCDALRARGDRVRPLLRPSSPSHPDGIRVNPSGGWLDLDAFAGVDAVVNHGGHSIGTRRWTAREKERIHDSRVRLTRTLAAAINATESAPRVLVSASASGYYGDRGEELLEEPSPAGDGFLARVCVDWEAAAREARTRTAIVRTGIVLDPAGGLLRKLVPVFRLGGGARLGSGMQWMPWISLRDEVAAILHLLDRDDAEGPFNVCAPQPVRNAEFTEALAAALHRPALLAVPGFALRMLFGDDAVDGAFLTSAKMVPSALQSSGFRFGDPSLRPALGSMLSR